MLSSLFTAEDLLRNRFAAHPAPLMELSAAVAIMQRRNVLFDHWRWKVARNYPRLPASCSG